MIIEFFGFPGSGKTTICNEVIPLLEEENIEVIRGTFDNKKGMSRIGGKILFSFFCLFCSPAFFVKHFISFLTFKMRFRFFLNSTYLVTRYKQYKNSGRLVLFDQGLLQMLWSFQTYTDTNKDHEMAYFLQLIERVIFVQVDKEVIKSRLSQRPYNGYFYNPETFTRQYLIYKDLKEEVRQSVPAKSMMCVDSNIPPRDNAQILKEQIIKEIEVN